MDRIAMAKTRYRSSSFAPKNGIKHMHVLVVKKLSTSIPFL